MKKIRNSGKKLEAQEKKLEAQEKKLEAQEKNLKAQAAALTEHKAHLEADKAATVQRIDASLARTEQLHQQKTQGFASIFNIKADQALYEEYLNNKHIIVGKDLKTQAVMIAIQQMNPVIQYLQKHPEAKICDFTQFPVVKDLEKLAQYHAGLEKEGKDLTVTFSSAQKTEAYKQALINTTRASS